MHQPNLYEGQTWTCPGCDLAKTFLVLPGDHIFYCKAVRGFNQKQLAEALVQFQKAYDQAG